ncbi:MAG TPA: hypothetical protein DC042_01760, partial [Bacteroidales bacterium]|nr:hypothetical protein [Bacteroidales bacterium]
RLKAQGASAQNKYVHGVMVNGQPVSNYRFSHKDIAEGGTIVLDMGTRPGGKN